MNSRNWLESLNQATEYLRPAYRFREHLPAAIQLLQPHFGSDYAVLLEASPRVGNKELLHFHRLLKIPAVGMAKEYAIPQPLLTADFSSELVLDRLVDLVGERKVQVPPNVQCYSFSNTELKNLKANRIGGLFMSQLELNCEEMKIFPLLLQGQLWGLLCFCSPQVVEVSPEGFFCTQIFCGTLADAMAQRQYDIRQTLKEEFLFSPEAASSIMGDIKQSDSVALLPEEHLLTSIVTNTVPGSIFLVDIKEGRAIFANTSHFLGYNIVDETNPLELFASIIHPDDLNIAILDFIYKLRQAADGEVISSEYRMQHKEGQWRWINERAKVFKRFSDGVVHQYVSIMQDITKERKAEETLQAQKVLLQATLNTLPDIKLRLNSMGQIISAFGTDRYSDSQNSLNDKYQDANELADFLPHFVVKGILANVAKANTYQELQTFEFFLANQGKVSYYEARIAPVDGDEAIIVLRNMTHLKEAQNDLREQNSKLDQKNRLLEKYIDSNLQLENFAYIASHDLREPLRTIRTFAQYLKRNMEVDLDEENRSHLNFVISAANRMNQLIHDLLKYSTVNSEPMTNEPIELPRLLSDILEELQTAIKEKGATVDLVDVPMRIYGSPARIQQLFQNLISNAIKFNKPDEPPHVIIRGFEKPDFWQFSVSDNGIGIDPEFHEHVFIIFKRLHTMDKYAGTGIGLALVKRIVTQHGGDIWLESEVGKGTTFTFTILK